MAREPLGFPSVAAMFGAAQAWVEEPWLGGLPPSPHPRKSEERPEAGQTPDFSARKQLLLRLDQKAFGVLGGVVELFCH